MALSKISFTAFMAMASVTNGMVVSDPTKTFGVRTMVKRDIKTPDPIPLEGIQEAVSVMETGRLYRYNVMPGEKSVVSKCEEEIAAYTGHKYCVGLNSCGSAIMLMMKCTGLEQGGEVLSNAFTFGAVPSAIEHAGGKAVYVESNYEHVMCVEDLEKKLVMYPNAKHVLVSHMRGKVGDMKAIADACKRHDAILLEDCAHSLGVLYDGEHSGHIGVASAISAQSYKMINSGEGGFLLTDDPDIAAKCAVYAGAYESLNSKHTTVPGPEYFKEYPTTIPNYSIRMSNLAAAVIRPQIKTLDERTEKYNKRYHDLVEKLEGSNMAKYMSIPKLTPEVTRMVHDSIQINLSKDLSEGQINAFLKECSAHGLPVELFGHKSNARNFVNWEFAPAEDPLPMTAEMLKRAVDCRMPLMWDDSDFEDLANVIIESLEAVVKK